MKAAVPAVVTGRRDLDTALAALKQNMDALTGQARNATPLTPLADSASLAEVIAQLNKVVTRLQ